MELHKVAYRYRRGSAWVLREVSVSLPPGRVIEVTGANGAGKSTLLRLAAGLLRPRAGSITGRPPLVGYAPERFPAGQPFTVAAYLRSLAGMRGVPPDLGRWTAALGMDGLLDLRLPELSKGSAHKVGLAQALLGDPGLLILDEPFAGLDQATREALPPLLAALAAEGTTVLVCDHQAALRALPGVDRLTVAGHTVTATADTREYAVIEVVVPFAEAPETAQALRSSGLTVRGVRREGPR